MQRIEIRPFPAGPSFMREVMELGAFGAQVCQALKMPAACDCRNFQEMPNTRTLVRGKMRNTNCVAMPKLPPPPPLHAQNKSGSEIALACRVLAWQSIRVNCWRASHVNPCDLASR